MGVRALVKKERKRVLKINRGGSLKKHLALIAVPRVGKMREIIRKKGLFFVFFFFFATLFVTPSSCSDSDSVTTRRYSQLNEHVRRGPIMTRVERVKMLSARRIKGAKKDDDERRGERRRSYLKPHRKKLRSDGEEEKFVVGDDDEDDEVVAAQRQKEIEVLSEGNCLERNFRWELWERSSVCECSIW